MTQHRHIPVALQLYSVRGDMEKDFTATLTSVATIGYKAVEMAGLYGHTAAQVRRLLDDIGVAAVSSHTALSLLRTELDKAIDDCLTLGCTHLVCPWLPHEERGDADGYRRLAEELTTIGARCKERGLVFAYHNHDFEFEQFGHHYALDILLETASPDLVKSELDVYWAEYAGVDPATYLRHIGSRCAIVHLKDMTRDDSRTFAEVGTGRLDFPAIFAAAQAAGVAYYVVEQDVCQRPPLESVAISLDNLRAWAIA